MSKLSEFLERHSELVDNEPTVPKVAEPEDVTLSVVLLAASTTSLLIGHLGKRFTVSREDVVDISEKERAPNTFGKGIAINLTLKGGARVISHQSISAAELTVGTPFVIARPSLATVSTLPARSSRAITWMRSNNLHIHEPSFDGDTATESQTQTATNSASQSPQSSISTANGGDVDQDFQDDDTLPDDGNIDGNIVDDNPDM